MKTLPGIIIARGGSKRTPRKNVRPFCGKSLTEWSIIQAQASEGCSPVVLSTDSDEIADIGERCGVMVLRRPVMPDNTAGAVAFNMAIDQLRMKDYRFDSFVSLLPTGPLRLPDDIDKAIELFWNKAYPIKTNVVSGISMNIANCIPGRKTGDDPFYKSHLGGANELLIIDNGLLSICDVKSYRVLLQTIDYDSRAVRRARRLVKRHHPYIYFYICKPWQFYDIDYPEEFEMCELIFKHFILDKGYYQ